MKYLIPIFIICLFSITNNSFAQTNKKITVIVKKVNGFGESSDGYTFTTTIGKEYYVYNEGGASPRKGELYIKKGAKICLWLNPSDGMGDIAAISKGKCKK
ncbi:hypothetical protein [Acinetobacter haemolyticus]|uniref:hypothetical protein n=1 Tax=Acinetobacter haemolyticus TaxID=29430 RepID=UPI000C2C59A6|nr:hypothetical protein [Acinetobacter haemolyticus]ATZ66785.1 hypothetical protein BSR56_05060 [Acinetobacter haemolyticus]